ncbi:MAG TPA: hypothetical protein VGB79_17470 [Allosphingosinicella sp.]|jgi:hypothetical protein
MAGRLVTIASVYNYSELHALVCLLRTNGVVASTLYEGHVRTEWITVALGGARIAIPEEQLPLAREILADIDPRPVRSPWGFVDLALFVMLALFFGVPPPARAPAHIYVAERREPA